MSQTVYSVRKNARFLARPDAHMAWVSNVLNSLTTTSIAEAQDWAIENRARVVRISTANWKWEYLN